MAAATPPDIDRILEAIRAEARARGSNGRVGAYPTDPAAAAGTVQMVTHGLPQPELKHFADFLALPLDIFIAEAYRHALGRDPDPPGQAHYQRGMLRGRLSRAEVLARLCYSPEGRRRARAVPGLVPALAFALLFKVPVAGPVAALAARLLRLPPHWQDRSFVEAAAAASGFWMKR